jgi:histidine triad (HIT) family protein
MKFTKLFQVIAKMLFRFAKRPFMGTLVGTGLAYAHWLLPIRRVKNTRTVLAFHHPKPFWKTHILLIPKRPIHTLLDLSHPEKASYFRDVLLTARDVVKERAEHHRGFLLCVNGGPRQEVQQVHFHLSTGEQYVTPVEGDAPPDKTFYRDPHFLVLHHPDPSWEVHLVIQPVADLPALSVLTSEHSQALGQIGQALQYVTSSFDLMKRGYTLVVQENEESNRLAFHIIAGKRMQNGQKTTVKIG